MSSEPSGDHVGLTIDRGLGVDAGRHVGLGAHDAARDERALQIAQRSGKRVEPILIGYRQTAAMRRQVLAHRIEHAAPPQRVARGLRARIDGAEERVDGAHGSSIGLLGAPMPL